jgi:hypothetical protein
MFAVIRTGGKQYRVSADDKITVMSLAGEPGDKVTFEVVAESFGLLGDAALRKFAKLVHFIDVGGIPVDEAPGLEMLVRGLQSRHEDDDQLLAAALPVFDACYEALKASHDS